MRYQRQIHIGNRPVGDHPRATQHNAETFFAKYKSEMTWNRLMRLNRLRKKDALMENQDVQS